ncbi:MAG: HRDC domain-containing protein [Chloroflexi bacterium]|nr:HRDC domain-containing protein [Chloroflexota bacterium]
MSAYVLRFTLYNHSMPSSPLQPPVWIATPVALHKLAGELTRQPRLAVDTESNSLYAYREQVCLIQFSTPETDYLVDPLALNDLSRLAPIFANPEIQKIFHAAEYDLITLKRDFGFTFTNLFDTMQATRILGYQQVGLDSILAEKFGVIVNKRFQKANWGQRPLPADLINYARLDTHYLLDLHALLQAELEVKDRLILAREEFGRISKVNGHAENGCASWQRVSGTQNFTSRELALLQELCAWREAQAQRMNRPVFKIVSHKILITLAQTAPQTYADLEALGLSRRQIDLFASDMLKAIRRGLQARPVLRSTSPRPDEALLKRLDALRHWRKNVAERLGVESDVVLPRPFMQAIAETNPQDIETLAKLMPDSPWRLEKYGDKILELLKK